MVVNLETKEIIRVKPASSFNHSKVAYSVEEAARLLSLSRSQLFRLIELREISTVQIGRSRRITYAQLEDYVRKLEQANGFARLS
jgi:excisionase family DNA binding protein